MWPFKKPKIHFFNLSPAIAGLMPIIPAYEYRPAWFHKCAAEYRKQKKDPEWQISRLVHTARCPGIHQILSHGWVMRTYQDLIIKTYNEGDPTLPEDCDWRSYFKYETRTSPIMDKCETDETPLNEMISWHEPEQYAIYFDRWDDGYLRTTLKLQMNWRAIIPPGYMLLEQPYPYPDHHDFKAMQGVYYPEYGTANLNLQILWRRTGKTILVPAGTPVALYMCIPKQDIDYDVREATKEDIRLNQISSMGYNASFAHRSGSQLVRRMKIFKP